MCVILMEPHDNNLHFHHQQQQQQYQHQQQQLLQAQDLPSSSPPPSNYGDHHHHHHHHVWSTPTINLNNSAGNLFSENANPLGSMIFQDLRSQWTNNEVNDHHLHMKDDLSDCFPKLFTEMLNSSSNATTSMEEDSHSQLSYSKIRDFSAGGTLMASRPGGRSFSQIYPSINISDLSRSSAIPSSFDTSSDLQPLDLFTNSRFCGSDYSSSNNSNNNTNQSTDDNFGLSFGTLDHFQQSRTATKISPLDNELTTEVRRASSYGELPKETQSATKKSRMVSRASCPPFKVRKQKLGDRIAALQQLVAPFGKTDTASVLMEAIGYIKFLQNQVETLSVPYTKSSSNKRASGTTTNRDSTCDNQNKEHKQDLRSIGLCLVPLSCMSYVIGDTDGGGSVWPQPPNFGGEI